MPWGQTMPRDQHVQFIADLQQRQSHTAPGPAPTIFNQAAVVRDTLP